MRIEGNSAVGAVGAAEKAQSPTQSRFEQAMSREVSRTATGRSTTEGEIRTALAGDSKKKAPGSERVGVDFKSSQAGKVLEGLRTGGRETMLKTAQVTAQGAKAGFEQAGKALDSLMTKAQGLPGKMSSTFATVQTSTKQTASSMAEGATKALSQFGTTTTVSKGASGEAGTNITVGKGVGVGVAVGDAPGGMKSGSGSMLPAGTSTPPASSPEGATRATNAAGSLAAGTKPASTTPEGATRVTNAAGNAGETISGGKGAGVAVGDAPGGAKSGSGSTLPAGTRPATAEGAPRVTNGAVGTGEAGQTGKMGSGKQTVASMAEGGTKASSQVGTAATPSKTASGEAGTNIGGGKGTGVTVADAPGGRNSGSASTLPAGTTQSATTPEGATRVTNAAGGTGEAAGQTGKMSSALATAQTTARQTIASMVEGATKAVSQFGTAATLSNAHKRQVMVDAGINITAGATGPVDASAISDTRAALPAADSSAAQVLMHGPGLAALSRKAKATGSALWRVYMLGPNPQGAEFVSITTDDKGFITGPSVDIGLTDGALDTTDQWVARSGTGMVDGVKLTLVPDEDGLVFFTDGEDGVANRVTIRLNENDAIHAEVIATRDMT